MSVGSKREVILRPFSRSGSPSFLGQPELFPLRTTVEFRNAVNGADVWGKVVAEDGKSYVVKETKGGASVPASEWVGTLLAEALNVTCARPIVIHLQGGELVFGSLEIVGAANMAETSRLLTSITLPPSGTPLPGLQAALSEIYVLDMFLNNIDRHDQNFMSVRNGSSAKLYAIDFARCLFWHNSFDSFPAENQNTVVRGREFRRRHGFDARAADRMIERIASMGVDHVRGILSQMPHPWLPDERRAAFVQWWDGQGRERKLDTLRKGLEDGSLL
jgi:hypothetical protein